MKRTSAIVLGLCVLMQAALHGAEGAQWEVFETSFESAKLYTNAFVDWHVYYFDPATGRKFDQGTINATAKAGDKDAKPVSFKKNVPSPQDWVLVFERLK